VTVRVAVIGSGGIARDHVSALARIPSVEVAYVFGSDLDRAASVAALAPGAKARFSPTRACRRSTSSGPLPTTHP
jgi:predicted dehydrogenase